MSVTLKPKNVNPGSTEQECGCFYDHEENEITLCDRHAAPPSAPAAPCASCLAWAEENDALAARVRALETGLQEHGCVVKPEQGLTEEVLAKCSLRTALASARPPAAPEEA